MASSKIPARFLPASSGAGFAWTMAINLTATGTIQSTALLLGSKVNTVSTTPVDSGVRLPSAIENDMITIVNSGLNSLDIYPAIGQTIDTLGVNNPFILLPGQALRIGVPVTGAWSVIDVCIYDDTNNNLVLNAALVTPPVPPIGALSFFARSLGGRLLPAFAAPSGLDSVLQPHMGRNRPIWWQPLGNATTVPLTTGIAAATAVGTATARNVATTNIATRIKRLGYVSAATVGALSGHFWAATGAQFTTGDGTGLGGFTYMERFVISDVAAVTGARMFIGMTSSIATPTNVEPNTLTNAMGFGQLSTDATQWYFFYGGSAAQVAIPMGTALGAPTLNNTAWDIVLFAYPNVAGKIGYEIKNLSTQVSVEGILNLTAGTQIPASTTLLAPRAWRCNNATALAVGLDIASMYIETDQ